MLFATVVCSLVALSSARMAYQLSAGVTFGRSAPFVRDFSCDNYPIGFYADTTNRCELYHVCEPIYDEADAFVGTEQYSFACGTKTVFSQKDLACTHPDFATPCDQAPSLYESSNAQTGLLLHLFPDEQIVDPKLEQDQNAPL